MSDSDDKPESRMKKEINDEVDIYSDVLSDQDSLITKLKEKVDKLSNEKTLLIKSLSSLQKNYEDLRKEYEDLKEKYKVVSFNSSALFKTAQAEIQRKDKLIREIRKEKDDLVFRRATVNQALHRSRKYAAQSPRKLMSPLKKQKLDRPILETTNVVPTETPVNEVEKSKSTEGGSSEKLFEPSKSSKAIECGSEEKNPKTTSYIAKEKSDSKPSSVQEEEKTHKPDQLSSSPKHNECNKTKVTPPPLIGTATTYSKRLYKRIHGVSPPKKDVSVNQDKSQKDIDLTPKSSVEETEIIKSDLKTESLNSKLQKEVKEIIKLGSPSKKSPPLMTKISPENQRQINTLVKRTLGETSKVTPPKVEKIIIQCDLRNTSKVPQQKTPNSVSMNETIDSILKKQRAGQYTSHTDDDNKDEEPKNLNANSNINNKSVSKLLANINKRASDKPKISPATFGQLIPHPTKSRTNVTPIAKAKLSDTLKEENSDSKKRKLSESFENEISPQQALRTPRETYPKTTKKSKFISSLFGKSPVKADIVIMEDKKPTPVKMRSPSPIEKCPRTSSPIFPDSPSLDSDNNEDLIIDTTACSQNTSPRVSESDKKDVNDSGENAVPVLKTPDLKSSSEPLVCSPRDTLKESEMDITKLPDSDILDKTNIGGINILGASSNGNDNQNTPVVFQVIDGKEDEKDKTVEKTVSKEEIPVCMQALHVECEVIGAPNHSDQVRDEKEGLGIIQLETSHSSTSLDKVLSPEKSCESQGLPLGNVEDLLKNNSKDDKAPSRFIPSPPQLTLVSAFKHSENSVFALAEDTVGFVRSLTRMRDISPIRTPDKKGKLFSRPLSELPQPESEILNPTGSEELKKKTSFEFLKPSDLDSKNNSLLPFEMSKIDNQSPKCKRQTNPTSATGFGSELLEKPEKDDSQEDGLCKMTLTESIQCFENQSHNQRVEVQTKYVEQMSGENSKAQMSNKKIVEPRINPFKRNKPVRRLTTEHKSMLTVKPDKHASTVQKEQKDCSKTQEIRNTPKQDKKNTPGNTNKRISMPHNPSNKEMDERLTCRDEEEDSLGKDKHLITTSISTVSVVTKLKGFKESPTKSTVCSPTVSTNVDIIKTFKRSESLKMAPKPIPKHYLNMIKNSESKLSKDGLESSNNKTQSITECYPVEGKTNNNASKGISENSDLDQISHITNINKKLRVSKYQCNPQKEVLRQLNPTESINGKNSKLPNEKNKDLISLSKENDNLNKKVLESKSNLHSRSYKERRRNDRRSVSLGPEVRLGTHISLPPVSKKKEPTTATRCKNIDVSKILPVPKVNENNSMKNSEKSGKSVIKSDGTIEKLSKEVIFQKESTKTVNNHILEKNINLQSNRSRSSSPKRHKIIHKCSTDVKATGPIKVTPSEFRRSQSPSPDHCNRNRSSHKVSFRKSPDKERRYRSDSEESNRGSPERNRRKISHENSSRKSSGGGRSRRSRYEEYRRRSRSPSPRHHRYQESYHRSRSSHHKSRHRCERSRSRSPEPKRRNFEDRSRHRSQNLRRRSSNSSSHSRDRSSHNFVPLRQEPDSHFSKNVGQKHASNSKGDSSIIKVSDCKPDNQAEENEDRISILSYKEELEKMRKEIEMLKGKVHQNDLTSKSSSKSMRNETQISPSPNENTKNTGSLIEKTIDQMNANKSITNDKTNTVTVTEKSESNQVKSAEPFDGTKVIRSENRNRPEITINSSENSPNVTQPSPTATGSTVVPQNKPKRIRRRAVKLDDSEVNIVSIK